jgi:predicted metal-binding membrane protein
MTSTARAEPFSGAIAPCGKQAARRGGGRAFAFTSALLLAGSVAGTIAWCGSMTAMPDMPMPGGWSMSMAWMRMPGQTWLGAGAAFLSMWVVMMVAMMLPSLIPSLLRYRRAVAGSAAARSGRLTALVGGGYFFVWTALGLFVFPAGVTLAAAEMSSPALSRAVPIAIGVVVAAAGGLQLTAWKARQLGCCREIPPSGTGRLGLGAAWRHGVRLGLRCCACCAAPTAILLVGGVMDLRVMAVVTAAISLERLAPAGARIAHATGVVALGAAAWLIVRAVWMP